MVPDIGTPTIIRMGMLLNNTFLRNLRIAVSINPLPGDMKQTVKQRLDAWMALRDK